MKGVEEKGVEGIADGLVLSGLQCEGGAIPGLLEMDDGNTNLTAAAESHVGARVFGSLVGYESALHAEWSIETVEVFVETGLQMLRSCSRPGIHQHSAQTRLKTIIRGALQVVQLKGRGIYGVGCCIVYASV